MEICSTKIKCLMAKAFKGFNKDLTCRGFQYEAGKTYEEESADLCNRGFHACEKPVDCFNHYAPGESVFREVELEDVSDQRSNDDTKIVGKKITIGAEIGIPEICKLTFEYVKQHCTNEHNAEPGKPAIAGNYGAATAGNYGAATAGESGAATAGNYGAATSRGESASGQNGLSVARGNGVKVKGGLGAVLVIVEENDNNYDIKEWKAVVVDGKTIKADTWYKLVNGELKEAE